MHAQDLCLRDTFELLRIAMNTTRVDGFTQNQMLDATSRHLSKVTTRGVAPHPMHVLTPSASRGILCSASSLARARTTIWHCL